MRIAYADGPLGPRSNPADIATLIGHTGQFELFLGWMIDRPEWLADPTLTGRTYMAGFAMTRAVAEGRFQALPMRLSAVPAFIGNWQPDVGVVTGVRRGDGYAFTSSVGYADSLALVAKQVVVEVNEDGEDLGAPLIVGNIVATVPRPPAPPEAPAAQRPGDAIDAQIGAHVVSLLPHDATLQFGPGGIGEAIANSLTEPVRIWSGLVTDAMATLADRDLLKAPAVTAYTWGGDPVRRLAAAGLLDLCSISRTHDLTQVAAIPRFVGCNTALQIGLDGAINLERVNGKVITSVGGHADFCVAASRSVGGMSIVSVRSTSAKGDSTIVPTVEVVSTQRSDIGLVITEHGIADLRGVDDAERGRRLVAVAAPEHRDRLSAAIGGAR